MIRNHLVVGIYDTILSEQLQMDTDLTLEKAKKSIHQREAVHEQQEILKSRVKQEPPTALTLWSTNSAKVPITGENNPHCDQRIALWYFASHLDHQWVVKSAFGVVEVLIPEQSAQPAKLFATSAKRKATSVQLAQSRRNHRNAFSTPSVQWKTNHGHHLWT